MGVDGDPNATVQAEALPPPVLAQIVRKSILASYDMDAHEQALADEEEGKEKIYEALNME